MRSIPHSAYLLVFLRTYFVGAAYNMRGLQNVGFMLAMDPGLKTIHKTEDALRKARGRYVRYFNCHPFFTPLAAGMFLHTENAIANGKMPPETLTAIKDTTTNTLSAIGDSLIGGTIIPTWALFSAFLVISGHYGAALAFGLCALVALQAFKLATFAIGVRYGLMTLFKLRKWDLINWGDKLKICNAVLLLLTFALCMLKEGTHSAIWLAAVASELFAAYCISRLHMPRTLLALIATTALLCVI
jgi:PTS system mannose-specific IID component